ncbi:hypothetical protein PVBG_06009 [Plasmodium vivax Brazil I]|uniref:Uncharacterized protein n=1 Tax=Plasmodium vivax (strain Brazil I) TaxID=1033975 RepID=A0A0J9T223_PLAV1|nr:hypothetical protein PVBG_06009 [Plasmodium vivax Brazil I]
MVLFINCNLGKKVLFTGFLKYFTFTFLIWTYYPYNDLGNFPKSLENKFRPDKVLNLIFKRLLAKYDLQSELQHGDLRKKLSDDISIYGKTKNKKPNNFEAYINDYKRRYRNKKGLYKLDCYCEKKVFDKILYVKGLSEKVNNDKKRFKKIFLKKYGIGLILFALIPALGFIYHILYGVDNWGNAVFPVCRDSTHNEDESISGNCKECKILMFKGHIQYMEIFNAIFSFTMITIILTFIIYIIIKLIKYEKLKAGKGKMNLMEYCRFCKELL